MTFERHARAKEIFLAAIASPQTERDSLIARHCAGDQSLENEVRGLMAAHVSGTVDSSQAPGRERSDSATRSAPSSAARGPDVAHAEGREFSPGTVIAQRYRIVSRLGVGGMGEVYRAEDLVLTHPVALKFLPCEWARDPRWIARLRNEARLARTVTHGNVCRIHDLGEWDNEFFLSMEYVDGEDLASLLRRIGRLPSDKAVDIARQICLGLAVAHRAGILHRDLKPANIMLDGMGQVRITDFGIAGVANEIASRDIRTGTAAYMAPEQITGREVTVRSDLYALGLVLFELFTGRRPFEADSLIEYVELHEHAQPPSPSTLARDIPIEVEQIILQCLRKDPADRPPSALYVAAALPACDVLNVAIAAQITPSPDLVAAAQTGKQRIPAVALGLAIFGLLTFTVLLRSHWPAPWDSLGPKNPGVMEERARALVQPFAPIDGRTFFTHGFCEGEEAFAIWDHIVAGTDLRLGIPENDPPGPLYWYRQSDRPIVPSSAESIVFGSGRATIDDPTAYAMGMIAVLLDVQGRLLLFAQTPEFPVPAQVEGGQSDFGFDAFVKAADLPMHDGRPPQVAQTQRADGTSRFEWRQVVGDSGSTRPVALGIARGGRPLFFSTLSPGDSPAAGLSTLQFRRAVTVGGLRFLFLGLTVVALPLAWRAFRSGSFDREGGLRLALLVVMLGLVSDVLRLGGVTTWSYEIFRVSVTALRSLGVAALVSIYYIVVDLLARRTWPNTLITWNRALRLRWRDTDVRRHIALGVCVGCYWAFAIASERAVVRTLEWPEQPFVFGDRVSEKVQGAGQALASFFQGIPQAIASALLALLLIVALGALMRSPRMAFVLTAGLLLPIFVPRGVNFITSWLFMGLGGALVCVWLLTQVGLLAVTVAFFVASTLATTPLTLNPSAWYASLSFTALAMVMGLGLYGLLPARANGRLTSNAGP